MMRRKLVFSVVVYLITFVLISQGFAGDVLKVSIQEAVAIALQNSRTLTVSRTSIEIAEAQHRQALSSYWPHLKLGVSAVRMDEDPNFIFPSKPLNLGPQAATPLAEAIANAQLAKMGVTPDSVGVDIYNLALAQAVAQVLEGFDETLMIPEQDIRLMDRDFISSTLTLTYPLYTGGRRSSLVRQARLGVENAKEVARRTDLQLFRDVNQIGYGNILAVNLLKLGQETLDRFEVTLELTERLYKTGSGRVKKTDYLRTLVIVSGIRSMLEYLKSNVELSKSALVNTMGLDWHTRVELSDMEIPFAPFQPDLEKIVTEAYRFNPRLAQVRIGLDASEAGIKEAKSGYMPMVVFFGNVNHIENSLDGGIMTSTNKDSWQMGIRMEFPVFEGFLTKNKVKEARARLHKLKEENLLLKEGIALQVKDAFLQVARAQGQVKATRDALDAATENRELNERAYQEELVETKDVIEAQLMEFFINGQYLRALFDNKKSQLDLEFMVGERINEDL